MHELGFSVFLSEILKVLTALSLFLSIGFLGFAELILNPAPLNLLLLLLCHLLIKALLVDGLKLLASIDTLSDLLVILTAFKFVFGQLLLNIGELLNMFHTIFVFHLDFDLFLRRDLLH